MCRHVGAIITLDDHRRSRLCRGWMVPRRPSLRNKYSGQTPAVRTAIPLTEGMAVADPSDGRYEDHIALYPA